MEDKKLTEEEIIDKVNICINKKIIIIQLYPYIAPENIDNSKIVSIIQDKYTIKIDDLLNQKEISKYIKDKTELISIIKKHCEFFKFLETDDEYISYNIPDNNTIFSILNIPPKLKKEEVYKNLELINLKYNRLYKNGFYWNLSTTDKETVICVQNSLRTLTFDDMKPKYSIKNKTQILDLIKEQVEKISYQKEVKNLGIGNNNKNNNKISKGDSDTFSWRKGSSESGNNKDYNYIDNRYKKGFYNYNNNYNYKKRKRFNSDNVTTNNQRDNYNYEEYNPYPQDLNKKIEIDASKLKYPLIVKYKYSFKEVQNIFEKIKNMENPFNQKNEFIFSELIAEKPKNMESFEKLIKGGNINEIKEDIKEDQINTNIKIPKINPLSNIGKGNLK